MRSKVLLALIAGTFIFTCGCQKNEANNRRDPIDDGYVLIDRGSYSEAIQNLTNLSQVDKRPQVLVALGSAYAARGGIKIEQYWGFIISFKAPVVKEESPTTGSITESLFKVSKQKGPKVEKKIKALGGLAKTSSVWDQYKDRIQTIPSVKGEQLKDMQRAVDVLANVKTPGGRLYRALLNLIIFKSYVDESQDFWTDFNDVIGDVVNGEIAVLCDFDFDEILKWLGPISHHLTETLTDLTIAFPEKEVDLIIGKNLVQAIYGTTQDAIQELRDKRMCK
ncbi:MAG: hypothetical protein IPM97_02805 [Bdellovibrionaceae bacterium]|nr:hypothetical protein [Pseudobdellovibrionaceae bacterium]